MTDTPDSAPDPSGRRWLGIRLNGRIQDRLFLVVSILMRMFSALGVLVILARGLGPLEYGLFSTVFSYAMIAALIGDFGYATKALRDIAADPVNGGRALAEAMSVKALLTFSIAVVGGVVIAFLPLSFTTKISCLAIGLGVMASSFGDVALVSYRAVGRFAGEAVIVTWTSILYAAILTLVVVFHGGIVAVGFAFLLARAVYMAVALRQAVAILPKYAWSSIRLRATLGQLRSSSFWALDGGLGYLNQQVDGVVVAHLLGLEAAGLYQSAARFTYAGLRFGGVLANIHIPRMARSARRLRFSHEWRMASEFIGLGCVIGLSLLIGGPFLTKFFLGAQYMGANTLWPGFAAFAVSHYIAAFFGTALSATSKPGLRVVSQTIGLLTMLVGLAIFLPTRGLIAAPWVMAAGMLITTICYAGGSLLRRG
jgi:O-antigen/teichoic acid export membrane protein